MLTKLVKRGAITHANTATTSTDEKKERYSSERKVGIQERERRRHHKGSIEIAGVAKELKTTKKETKNSALRTTTGKYD